jgi:leucyl-tRNA synthetase
VKTITKYSKENRRKKTLAEKRMFRLLRWWGIRFRSQRPFDFYIVDYLIPDRRLVVEVDGMYHESRKGYDQRRDAYLVSKGLTILRITNEEVLNTDCERLKQEILSYPVVPIDNWREVYGQAKY